MDCESVRVNIIIAFINSIGMSVASVIVLSLFIVFMQPVVSTKN